jgi:hypothetical protein
MANNKRGAYYADAERLYVQEQLTLETIAAKLGLSVRSLQTWKTEGEWDRKRKGFQETSASWGEELFELARLLTTKNLNRVKENTEPDKDQLGYVVKIAAILDRSRKFEQQVTEPKEDPAQKKAERLKDLRDRVNEMFGVDLDAEEDDD